MTQQQKTGESNDTLRKQELHAQIDETKSAIAGELRELGEKLKPEHLKEGMKDMLNEAKTEAKEAIHDYKEAVVGSLRSAKDNALDSVSETMSEVGDRARRAGVATADFVSANAVPLSLIGLGAGWLMLTMRRQRMLREQGYLDYDYYGRSYDRGSRRLSEWSEREYGEYGAHDWEEGSMLEGAKGEAQRLAERGGDLVERGMERAERGMERVERGMERGMERVERAVERTKEGASHMRDRVAEGASHARDRMAEGASHARQRMSSSISHLGDRASELSHSARERFDRYQHNTVEFAQENPLAISALAVAAGVGFGLMLPPSRIENRLMGPTRGRLMGEARELMDDAKETAQRAAQAAKETVNEVKSTITSSGPSH